MLPGQRRQRQRIGADIHLAVAIADRQRAAAPGADQQIVLAGEQEDERERAFEPRQRARHRLRRGQPLRQVMRRQDRDRLGIGLRDKAMTQAGQLAFQLLEILDNAVMDDGDPVGRDRMRVVLGRQAVRRPARVADADRAVHRLAFEPRGEVGELALRRGGVRCGRRSASRPRPNHSRGIRDAAAPRSARRRPAACR